MEMAIEYYIGVDGPTITSVSSPQELYEALDVLHSLVVEEMEKAGETPTLNLMAKHLSDAMERMVKTFADLEE
jgi:hypothetical protein